MQLLPQSLNQALNKGYLKQSVTRDEINAFKANLVRMFARIDEDESEENLKNIVSDFLKDTYYSPLSPHLGQGRGGYEINTKDRKDLVIHHGKTSKDPVGLILEAKKPANKAEMMTLQNPNKKALQELVLYYLKETYEKNNHEIKYLVVTNIWEWYILDGIWFEKHIFKNYELKKAFETWKVSGQSTQFFYDNIAKVLLEKIEDDLPCTYFNLKDFRTLAEAPECEEDNELISLYKIFSPEHLLRKPFANDSNTLNKAFYFELLYILGLGENKEESRRLIQRKMGKERQESSLLENTINKLSVGNKFAVLNQQEFVEAEKVEKEIFEVSLELCITWLNRILFLKLLEGQLISFHKGLRDFAFLNTDTIKDFDELDELFFEVLAVPIQERKASVIQKFGNIPYLNSSLFEYTELEKKYISIGCLKDRLKLPLYFQTVLKDGKGKQMTGEQNTLHYLFQFLDSFNFSTDSDAAIQTESKTLINSAVLGLFFEKINGYQEGSFFTPGFITMYMCRETIRKAVVQKFNEITKGNYQSFEQLKEEIDYSDKNARKAANEVINSLKICDPSVGSGHFLVSALNEIVAIKNELQILCYQNGDRIRAYKIEIEHDEIVISDKETNQLFQYRLNQNRYAIDELQELQEAIFHEKKTIIENCLFGVDINPKSVAICRLRLWIELLKNMYYTQESNYTKLETLPNIDINIKCGNSLISKFQIENKNGFLMKDTASRNTQKTLMETYKENVFLYKNLKDRALKTRVQESLVHLKNTFMQMISPADKDIMQKRKLENQLNERNMSFHFFSTAAEKEKWDREIQQLSHELIETENRIQNKIKLIYHNALEWRFEFPEALDENGNFVGFDVIIGNPPYGLFNKKQNQKVALSVESEMLEIITKEYPEVQGGTLNAARIFYALGFKLLKDNGFQAMIIPFGVLTDTTSAKLRRHIFENYCFVKIDAFPERDNTKKRVFEEVKMSTAIIFSQKGKLFSHFDLGVSYEKKINQKERLFLQYTDIQALNPELLSIPITSKSKFHLLQKIYSNPNIVKLGTLSPCLTGEIDISLAKNAIVKDATKSDLVKGVQIDRYTYKNTQAQISQGEIAFLDDTIFKKSYKGIKIQHANMERVVIQGLTGINETGRIKATLLTPPKYLANSCNYFVPNTKISSFFLLALLNSQLLNFVFKCNSTSSNVNGYEVDNLPILLPENVQLYITLTMQILTEKQNNYKADISQMLQEIDKLVYELYEITAEEIAIIEGKI